MPERLMVKDLITLVGLSRDQLYTYLTIPENRALLGGEGRLTSYPAESLPLFHRLAELHSKGVMRPKHLAANFDMLKTPSEAAQLSATPSAADVLPDLETVAVSPAPAAPVPDLFSGAVAAAIALPASVTIGTDSLLTEAEAARHLACTPEAVNRYVKPRYALSDIHAYINDLREKVGAP